MLAPHAGVTDARNSLLLCGAWPFIDAWGHFAIAQGLKGNFPMICSIPNWRANNLEVNTPMHFPVTTLCAVMDPLKTIHGVRGVNTFDFQCLFGDVVRLYALAMYHPMHDINNWFEDGHISVTVATP